MAEETPMSPVSETVPPKANPLATPASAHASTLKLNPVSRPATTTQSALRPGLKLPPKPGLSAGLKLPPKQGATVSGLKPGVRLPSQSALKPGLKLPTQSGLKAGIKLPARPVIRKPGATVKAAPPVVAPPTTVVAQAVTQVTSAAPKTELPKVEAPKAEAPKVEAPKPLEALKTITQNLKSITSPIPQQAILRKTGIIADAEMTEAQKQAAKSKTARISLSDAMGVAPVKSEALPMKTIRIKRPVDIPGATGPATTPSAAPTVEAAAEPPDEVDSQAVTKISTAPATAPSTSFTQRKTLKISRPGGGAVRPSGKFGIKRPMATAPAKPADGKAPEGAAPGEVADIPEIPTAVASMPVPPVAAQNLVPDVPKGVATVGLIAQIAACVAMAFLGWLLYQNTQLPLYCGGCL